MKKINIELTEQEAKNLVQLLDLAVKSGGLNVAAISLPIAQNIESQLYPQPEKESK